ncbi:CASP-like protein 1 [Heracleum sosnowskyi]|uniref:CASP-like protein n=1 Tax=Heracleum sosnowskyi TaxID=360622 RepID=A0AAD8IKX9_9APIA|nr:CASP-like protein 1 [Heracleum sosnowskyi]
MASRGNQESKPTELKLANMGNASVRYMRIEVILRSVLFTATLTSVMALVTSKQTELIPIPFPPYGSPKYSLAVLSLACLYSIITTLLCFAALMRRSGSSRKFMSCVVVIDVLLLGIIASATGVAGEVAYLGLKGNSNVGWHKICNVYDSYCRHIGISVLSSLFTSIVLSILIVFYIVTLSRTRNNSLC